MILLVSGATRTLQARLGMSDTLGELIVPGAGNAPDALHLTPGRWAMDNGAFSRFDVPAFMRMLERFAGRLGCLFVAAPDVVGHADQTLAHWRFWAPVIAATGFAPAFVAQDGQTVRDVPWSELGALFIGGTTTWKLSRAAVELAAYAKARGVFVHVGRVNSALRFEQAHRLGADSVDGTCFSRWPDTHIPRGLTWIADIETQPRLF